MIFNVVKNEECNIPHPVKEPKLCKLIEQNLEQLTITVLFYKEQQPVTYHVTKFNETEVYTKDTEYYLLAFANNIVTLS